MPPLSLTSDQFSHAHGAAAHISALCSIWPDTRNFSPLFTAACTGTLLRAVPVRPGPTGSTTSHRQDTLPQDAGATPAADDDDEDEEDEDDSDACVSLSGPLMSTVRGRSRCRRRIFVLVYLKRNCGSGRSGSRSGRCGGLDLRCELNGTWLFSGFMFVPHRDRFVT